MVDDEGVVAPTRSDPIARGLSQVIGGPVGRRALPHRWWTPVRVLLAIATVTLALGIVQKAPCVRTQWGDTELRYGAMCYSDIPYLYTGRGMAERVWPYSDTHGRYEVMEYPVGISYFAYAAAELTSVVAVGPTQSEREHVPPDALWGLPGMTAEVNQYFVVNAILLAALGLLSALFLAGASPGRPFDAVWFVASPCLLVAAYINWDMLAVVCVAGALWAWARGRSTLVGVFIGLGTAMKLYPVFLLGAVLVICVRNRRVRQFLQVTLAALASWVLLNIPAWLTGIEQWKVFWEFNSKRGPDLGSLWLVASLLGHPASADTVNKVSWVAFALACVAVLVIGLRSPRRPRLAQLGFLIVASFLIINKVYSPQYVLWLLPLAVLARPRWRDLIIWQCTEMVYFASVWWYLGGFTASATSSAPDPAYLFAIGIRVVGEIYLMSMIVRDLYRQPNFERTSHGKLALPM